MSLAKSVNDFLIASALPTYSPSGMWREDQDPFTTKTSNVLLTKQSGRPVDAYVRRIDVDVFLFSPVNADGAAMQQVEADTIAALQYVKANFRTAANQLLSVTQDVTGPYHTAQGRIYYRFSLVTFSE
jgi:hypothetical protein